MKKKRHPYKPTWREISDEMFFRSLLLARVENGFFLHLDAKVLPLTVDSVLFALITPCTRYDQKFTIKTARFRITN